LIIFKHLFLFPHHDFTIRSLSCPWAITPQGPSVSQSALNTCSVDRTNSGLVQAMTLDLRSWLFQSEPGANFQSSVDSSLTSILLLSLHPTP
jgi:hypothetical protein